MKYVLTQDLDQSSFSFDTAKEKIAVRLSSDAGNQLQFRDNGLYYGVEAPPDLRDTYISSSRGSDDNPGTKEKPFKTIQAALSRLPNNPFNYQIWLYENDTFEWCDYSANLANFNFRVYGPTVDAQYPESVQGNAYYYGHVAKGYPRPVIKIQPREYNGFIRRQSLHANEVYIRGVHFDINNAVKGSDNPNLSGYFAGIVNGNIGYFYGCVFDVYGEVSKVNGYRQDSMVRTLKNRFANCEFLRFENITLVYGAFTPSVSRSPLKQGTLNPGTSSLPAHELLTEDQSFKEKIKVTNIADGISYDTATKSLFGVQVDWDIFA